MPATLKKVVTRAAQAHPKLPIDRVFGALHHRYRGHGSWFAPSKVAEEVPDVSHEALLRAFQALSDEPFKVLFTRWVIFGARDRYDPMDPDDQEECELDPREAFEAVSTGEVVHPVTGSLIPAMGRVVLYYVTNDSLWARKK